MVTAKVGPRAWAKEVMTPQRATALAAALATFMAIMDTQIVNVALATITRDFHGTTASVQWVVTAYALSLAVCIPASGWLGDRFGTKRVFVLAILVFTAASALCAAAPSLPALIVLRTLQGVGGALLTPVGLTMVYRAYPQSKRIRVTRLMSAISVIAPATAPVIGGVLVSALSWRWIFLVNVPIGLLLALFSALTLKEYRQSNPGPYDPAGLLLGGIGLALVLYAISEGPVVGWISSETLGTVIAGVALIAAFVHVELARRQPMLNLRLLKASRIFRTASILQLLQPVPFIGSLVFTSLYGQETRGFSALISGTTTLPEAIAIGLVSGIVPRMYRRLGPRRLALGGFALLTAGALGLGEMGATTSLWLVRACTATLGVGTACMGPAVQVAGFAQISVADTGHASAITNTARQAGAAAAVAILSAVLTLTAGASLHPSPADFHFVFRTAATFALLGLLLSLTIRDADAANTLGPRSA